MSHCSGDHATVPGTVKIMFTDKQTKQRITIKNEGKALEKKRTLIYGSKKLHTINKADLYNTYTDLCSSQKNAKRSCFKLYS